MRRLFICEKPSLAKALADVLAGGTDKAKRANGYFKVGEDNVAWLKGHIMALYEPEDYFSKWADRNCYPVFPEKFKKKIKDRYDKDRKTDDYLNIFNGLKNLIKEADVLVNAGDPDAEGQILVDEVIEELNWQGDVQRIFINAYDDETINRALSNIEDNKSPKNVNVSKAALCRAITDWLIGMNGSRKFSHDAHRNLTVGRVKVPIMGIIKRRNDAIASFKSVKYYEPIIYARFGSNVPFQAVWKAKEDSLGLDEEGRLVDITYAREIVQKVTGKEVTVLSVDKKHKKESPPLPFSLSALQQYACSKLNITLKELDDLLQNLYEVKKLLTYPRSDCQYIPESQFADAKIIISNLKVTGSERLKKLADNADSAIMSKAFDTSKTSAHHAIIPTMTRVDLSTLSDKEKGLYEIVSERYLLQFYPLYEYDATEIVLECESETFIAKGKVVTSMGWKSAIDSSSDDEEKEEQEEKELPGLQKGDIGKVHTPQYLEKDTVPPKHFTAESLIAALTNAQRYVLDKNLAEVIKSVKGIGTPATRSTIIDGLLKSKLLIEKKTGAKSKKYLFVSDEASDLVDCLPQALTYPDQTALMELDLDKVASGDLALEDYVKTVEDYVRGLMEVESDFKNVECPACHKGYLKKGKSGNWFCSNWNDSMHPCNAGFADFEGKPLIVFCPECETGYLKQSKSKETWYCSNFFAENIKCQAGFVDVGGKPYLEKCSECDKGYIRRSKEGDYYCSNYKNGCKAHFKLNRGKFTLLKEVKCPTCGKGTLKKNQWGRWSCSNWQNCKESFEDVGGKPYVKKCTVCNKGYVKKSKAGKWYCTNFKNCEAFYVVENGKPVLSKGK